MKYQRSSTTHALPRPLIVIVPLRKVPHFVTGGSAYAGERPMISPKYGSFDFCFPPGTAVPMFTRKYVGCRSQTPLRIVSFLPLTLTAAFAGPQKTRAWTPATVFTPGLQAARPRGVAGLIGMPNLFGVSHNYGSTIQTGIGFAGIAVALLGRNNPVGIAFGALIFAWLNEQASPLGIMAQISPDIIAITQGAVVLSVVIAYELVRRTRQRLEQRSVAEALDVRTPGVGPEVIG